MVDNIAPLKDR